MEDVEQRRDVEGVTGGHVISKYDFKQKLHPALSKSTNRARLSPPPALSCTAQPVPCSCSSCIPGQEEDACRHTNPWEGEEGELKEQPGRGKCCLVDVVWVQILPYTLVLSSNIFLFGIKVLTASYRPAQAPYEGLGIPKC